MSRALEDILGASITEGIAITKDGHLGQDPLKHFNLYLANHPIPDKRGFTATQKVVELRRSADEETLVICLISGGGSALLVAPYGPVDLHAKQAVTELLLMAGVNIKELNAVRKHLSAVKGGRLAEIAWPARVIGSTIRLAREKGVDPQSSLDNNDSYTYFRYLNDLLVTGPTGTNVMDLQIVIVE